MQGAAQLYPNTHLKSGKHKLRPLAEDKLLAVQAHRFVSSGRHPRPSAVENLRFSGSSLCRGPQPQSFLRQRLCEPREQAFDPVGAQSGGAAKLAQPVQVSQPGKDGASPAQIFQTALNALDLFDSADEVEDDSVSYEEIAVDQQQAAAAVVGRAVYEVGLSRKPTFTDINHQGDL